MAISQIVQNSLANTISLGPKITSVQVANSSYVVKDDTAINIGGGFIVITGSGFQSNCSVIVDSNLACSVAFVSATEVRAQLPAKPAGTYNVYLLNGDGGTAIRVNALQYSNTPIWVTESPLTSVQEDTSVSVQLSATGANSYALQSGSTLPTGLTLSANGLISGTVNTNVSVATTYNFTVEAIDTENQETPKAFAITITIESQIARSLRFNSADSARLTRTPGSTSSQTTGTFSVWLKRTAFNNFGRVFATDGANFSINFMEAEGGSAADSIRILAGGGTLVTSAVFRDPAAWYHFVFVFNTTSATASDRLQIWVNGVRQTAFSTSTYPNLNATINFNNSGVVHNIGSSNDFPVFFDGYMAEIHWVDGQALTPSTFGQWSNNFGGTWVPKGVAGVTYGTNGFYLPLTDNSGTTSTTLGKDAAGSNNWTPSNFSVTAGVDNDSLLDSPTPYGTDDGSGADVRGSYATFNQLTKTGTLSNGSLQVSVTSQFPDTATVLPNKGKWYWECDWISGGGAGGGLRLGIANEFGLKQALGENVNTWCYLADGRVYHNGATASYGIATTPGARLMIALDIDAGKVWYGANNTWMASGNPETGANPSQSFTANQFMTAAVAAGSGTQVLHFNFGQRPFAYTAPSGFNCLVSQNITPNINANTTSTFANSYFGTVTYTGNGTTQNITGLNFTPDFVWIKRRDSATNHALYDAVRGAGNALFTNATEGEAVGVNDMSAFNSGGFSVAYLNRNETNLNNATYTAWCWNAGGSNATNNNGTVTSTVRANQTAGFSIVSFAVPSTGTIFTVGHGLGKTPKFIIFKGRGASDNWVVYHHSISTNRNDFLRLNTTDTTQTISEIFGNTGPNSTVFGGKSNSILVQNQNAIAYCWTDIDGYSKFSSYVGNGSTDGPFVYTGFRPAFVMVKNVSAAGNWELHDSVRGPINPVGPVSLPNLADADVTTSRFDFLSNGFKLRGTGGSVNGNTNTMAYVAFAENPFKYARAR